MQQENNIFNQIQKKRANLRNRNSFITKKSFILFPLASEDFNLTPNKPSKELRSSRSQHSKNGQRKLKTLKKGGSAEKAPKIQLIYHKTQQKHASNKSIKLDESLMAIQPKKSGRKIPPANINQCFKDYLTYIRAEQDEKYQLRVNFQNMRKRNRRDPLKNKEKQIYSTIYNILLNICQNLFNNANQSSKLIFDYCQRYFGLYEKIKIEIIISMYYPTALHGKLRNYFLNQRIAFFTLSAFSVDEGLKNLSRIQVQSLKLIFQLLIQGYSSLFSPILLQEKEAVSNINQAFRLLKSAGEVQKKLLIIDKQMVKINIQSETLNLAQVQLKALGKLQNQWPLQILAEIQTKLAWQYLKIPPVPYLPLKNTLKRYTLVIQVDNTLIYYNKETKILKYRPYIDLFLHKVSNFFEIVAFNKSEHKYTSVLITQIERKKLLFAYVLSERHLVQADSGLIKDISRINRQQSSILIMDCQTNYYHQEYRKNILKIGSWHGDKTDKELQKVLAYIEGKKDITLELIKSQCADVRTYLHSNRLDII